MAIPSPTPEKRANGQRPVAAVADRRALGFDSAEVSLLDSPEMVRFVAEHRNADTASLRLKLAGKSLGFDLDFALTQIECRRKTQGKLNAFLQHPEFMFPSSLAAQQATHEEVAAYHASLVGSGRRVLDLTAGLGVDSLTIAKAGNRVTAVEIESWKCEVLRHNSSIILSPPERDPEFASASGCPSASGGDSTPEGVSTPEGGSAPEGDSAPEGPSAPGGKLAEAGSLAVICDDALEVASEIEAGEFDVVFLDPARRHDDGSRAHAFSDCSPDLERVLPLLRRKAGRVIVKASPSLDATEVLRIFPGLWDLRAVSRRGECKELLLEFRKEAPIDGPLLEAIDLQAGGETQSFAFRESNNGIAQAENNGIAQAEKNGIAQAENHNMAPTGDPGIAPAENRRIDPEAVGDGSVYLCEPNASVMKLAPWREIQARWPSMEKADPNTQLFLTQEFPEGFPGRVIKLSSLVGKKEAKALRGSRMTIVSRNHPQQAPEIRRRLGILEGEGRFLYAFRWNGKPVMAEGVPAETPDNTHPANGNCGTARESDPGRENPTRQPNET